MRSHFLTLISVLVLSMIGVGCVVSAPDVPQGSDQSVFEGRKVWTTFCSSCHGPSGNGGRGPSVQEIEKKYVNLEDVLLIISKGRNGMPAFEERLSKEEIESVYSYIREVL